MTKYNKIRRVFFLFAFIFLTLHGTLRQASANWYVGTPSIQDYGVSANISAPSSPPYMEPVPSTQQYHWVSTISDSWIQIGWSYGLNYPKPLSYVEICLVHCTLVPRYFVEFEPHPFGATRNYKVDWTYAKHTICISPESRRCLNRNRVIDCLGQMGKSCVAKFSVIHVTGDNFVVVCHALDHQVFQFLL